MAIQRLPQANTKAVRASNARLAAQAQAQARTQQLGMPQGVLPGAALGLGAGLAAPGLIGPGIAPGLAQPGMLPGMSPQALQKHPQLNATNQSALAPNGTVNQEVSNANTYEHKFYNIFQGGSPTYGGGGVFGGGVLGGVFGGAGYSGGGWGSAPVQCGIDPYTGAAICQPQRGGIIGWLQRLFRGY